ncbi:hypothetical protein ABK040_009737 [Willaertia magna]
MSLNVVKLNIGGTKFTTTEETLLSEKDTFFSGLIQFEKNSNSNKEELFIDRNPQYFLIILNHLRGHNVYSQIKSLSYYEKELLAEDVTFYNVVSMFKYFPLLDLANKPKRKVLVSDSSHLYIYDLLGKRIVHAMKNEYVKFIEKLGEHCDCCLTCSSSEFKLWDLKLGTLMAQQGVGQNINEIQLLETNNENQFYILINTSQLWFLDIKDCSFNHVKFQINDFENLYNLKENSCLVVSSSQFLVKTLDKVEKYSLALHNRSRDVYSYESSLILSNTNGLSKEVSWDALSSIRLFKLGLTIFMLGIKSFQGTYEYYYSLDVNNLMDYMLLPLK